MTTFGLLVAVLNLGVLSAAQAVLTLCSDTETILFSCASGKKIISVCASNLSAYGGLLQYRFGTKGVPEIRLPPAAEEWRKSTVARHLDFAGGGGAYVAFANPPYRYVVYGATSGHWGTKEGVAVESAGKPIGHFSCTQKSVSKIGPILLREGGFPEDPDDFFLLP
jgi:hypothetical protein